MAAGSADEWVDDGVGVQEGGGLQVRVSVCARRSTQEGTIWEERNRLLLSSGAQDLHLGRHSPCRRTQGDSETVRGPEHRLDARPSWRDDDSFTLGAATHGDDGCRTGSGVGEVD